MKRILALAALSLSLSGCFFIVADPTPTTRPVQSTSTVGVFQPTNPRPVVTQRPPVTSIIRDFQSDRGNGASYRIGEGVFFRMTVARGGFITLVFYNDGSLPDYEIRNIAVQAGLNLIPNTNEVVASAPTGITRVRAFFTTQSSSNVSFLNGSGISFLEDTTNNWLNQYPVEVRDVRDTFVVVTR